jgi:flagellar biosynthetic protein FliO
METVSQLGAVALVLALLGSALWWLRRRGLALPAVSRRPGRRMECLERLPLGPQHTLHLVEVGDTTLLIASAPGGCSLVRSFPASVIANKAGRSE